MERLTWHSENADLFAFGSVTIIPTIPRYMQKSTELLQEEMQMQSFQNYIRETTICFIFNLIDCRKTDIWLFPHTSNIYISCHFFFWINLKTNLMLLKLVESTNWKNDKFPLTNNSCAMNGQPLSKEISPKILKKPSYPRFDIPLGTKFTT